MDVVLVRCNAWERCSARQQEDEVPPDLERWLHFKAHNAGFLDHGVVHLRFRGTHCLRAGLVLQPATRPRHRARTPHPAMPGPHAACKPFPRNPHAFTPHSAAKSPHAAAKAACPQRLRMSACPQVHLTRSPASHRTCFYPWIVSKNEILFPNERGEFKLLTSAAELNIKEYYSYGIYRAKIECETDLNLFRKSPLNKYTHFDLQHAKELGYPVTLIEEGQPNHLQYTRNKLITGKQWFATTSTRCFRSNGTTIVETIVCTQRTY